MARRRIGLALGAGGARGWCHVGVLRGLEDIGVRPDIITGASMGALVGATYAGGVLDALEEWGRGLTLSSFVRLIDISPSSGGLTRGREIANVLTRLGLPETIEEMQRPFGAVATDMESGREIWLREGSATQAVRASVAIPGVIAPARVGGQWLLDGGLTNPVPVSLARAMGAEIVIAVNPNAKLDGRLWRSEMADAEGGTLKGLWRNLPQQMRDRVAGFFAEEEEEHPPHYLDVIATALDVMTEGLRRSRLAGDPPHILLNADLNQLTFLDFHRAAEAIDEGHRIVEDQSGWIERLCTG